MEGKGNSYYNKQHLLRNTVSGPVVSTSPYSLTYFHNNPMKKALGFVHFTLEEIGA